MVQTLVGVRVLKEVPVIYWKKKRNVWIFVLCFGECKWGSVYLNMSCPSWRTPKNGVKTRSIFLQWCALRSLSAALPWLKIWVENSMYHTFDHNVWEWIVSRRQQVGVSQKQQDRLMWKFTWFLWFCIKWPTAFCFWHWRKMADIQEIQEYLWENSIFHNYSLQVELQTMSPLLQDFGNPVSNMFGGDLRWLYALL